MQLPKLTRATLLRRYKRFLADVVDENGLEQTLHCPNTGAMTGCAEPGSTSYFSVSDNPQRKYPGTLEFVETTQGLVSVNTNRANALIGEALKNQVIDPLAGALSVRSEAKIPDESGRFDFLVEGLERPAYVEVKSVTLAQEQGWGAFPDAVSARALKHVEALQRVVACGHRGVLLFCVQHLGISRVRLARDVDVAYAKGVERAMHAGVEVYAYACTTNLQQMQVERHIEFSVGA